MELLKERRQKGAICHRNYAIDCVQCMHLHSTCSCNFTACLQGSRRTTQRQLTSRRSLQRRTRTRINGCTGTIHVRRTQKTSNSYSMHLLMSSLPVTWAQLDYTDTDHRLSFDLLVVPLLYTTSTAVGFPLAPKFYVGICKKIKILLA